MNEKDEFQRSLFMCVCINTYTYCEIQTELT